MHRHTYSVNKHGLDISGDCVVVIIGNVNAIEQSSCLLLAMRFQQLAKSYGFWI